MTRDEFLHKLLDFADIPRVPPELYLGKKGEVIRMVCHALKAQMGYKGPDDELTLRLMLLAAGAMKILLQKILDKEEAKQQGAPECPPSS